MDGAIRAVLTRSLRLEICAPGTDVWRVVSKGCNTRVEFVESTKKFASGSVWLKALVRFSRISRFILIVTEFGSTTMLIAAPLAVLAMTVEDATQTSSSVTSTKRRGFN